MKARLPVGFLSLSCQGKNGARNTHARGLPTATPRGCRLLPTGPTEEKFSKSASRQTENGQLKHESQKGKLGSVDIPEPKALCSTFCGRKAVGPIPQKKVFSSAGCGARCESLWNMRRQATVLLLHFKHNLEVVRQDVTGQSHGRVERHRGRSEVLSFK